MRNKAKALRLLREWPVEKWCKGALINSDGRRCSLGVLLGRHEYPAFLERHYGLDRATRGRIAICNDHDGLDGVIKMIEETL